MRKNKKRLSLARETVLALARGGVDPTPLFPVSEPPYSDACPPTWWMLEITPRCIYN